mgnify:FL=1
MALTFIEEAACFGLEGERVALLCLNGAHDLEEATTNPEVIYRERKKDRYFFVGDAGEDSLSYYAQHLNLLHGYGLIALDGSEVVYMRIGEGVYRCGLGSLRYADVIRKRSSVY